jgi:hypothetical protein
MPRLCTARDPLLKILVCTKTDLPSLLALNRLLPALAAHDVEVFLTEKTRPAERTSPELGIIKFLERDLPFQILFPLSDAASRTDHPTAIRSFTELAETFRTPVTTIQRINKGDGLDLARAFAPDLVVSIRFSLVFRGPMLELPRHGILNLHPGPLPGYGGLFAIFRQMLAGRTEIGITLHKVDAGIDTGPVVTVTPMAIDQGRSMMWHVLRAYAAGVDSIVEAVRTLDQDGSLPAVAQDPARMHYYHLPDAALFRAFAEAGRKLYDFEEYGDDLRTCFGLSHPPLDGTLMPGAWKT